MCVHVHAVYIVEMDLELCGDWEFGFVTQSCFWYVYSRLIPAESFSLVHLKVYSKVSIFTLCVSFLFIRMYSLVFLFYQL